MKSDSPAAINAAIETVREGEPIVGDTCRANWHAANELLARELVRLIDAGELVRVRVMMARLVEIRDTGPIDEGDQRAEDYRLGWNEALAQIEKDVPRLAAALVPLFAKEMGT